MQPASVLIVDDQPENLLALAAVLEPLGHPVVQASSGEEALKRLLESDFAVILLDVQMPGLDGFETAEYIKRRERSRHVPLIFVTAIDKEAHHVFRGYSTGAVDYLFKPYEPEILRSKVAVFLELHEKSAALRESEERFRTAFADAPIGIGLLSIEGRLTQVNRALAEITGSTQADLIDTQLDALLHPDERAEEARALAPVLAGELPARESERRVRRPAGDDVDVLLNVSRLTDGDGDQTGFIVQVVDVTERRRAERERSERMREQAAREQAEAVTDTIRKLQSVADVALSHLKLDALLPELCEQVAGVFDADAASILLSESTDSALEVAAAVGIDSTSVLGVSVAHGEGFAGRIAVTRTPAVARAAGAREGLPVRRELEALMGAALVVDGHVRGVLEVGSVRERDFTAADLDLLQLVADRAARAIDHARLYARESDVAETLQRSLLPDRLPRLAGLALAARYLPGGEVGGDWYDVIGLDDDRVVLIVGDVVGHGLDAAALMGQLRNSLRAFALEGHSPAAMLERLDRVVRLGDGMATVVCAALEPDLRSMRLASAGHPPVLVLGSGGTSTFLEGHGSVPLGVGRGGYEDAVLEIEPGARLVLFTDGLVEDRGSSLDAGLERLRGAAVGGPDDVDALCTTIVSELGRDEQTEDDVTLLIAVTAPIAPEPLRLLLPADPSALSSVRRRLGLWLDELGASPDERRAILAASHEACANSMEHGYGFGDHTLELMASVDDGGVAIVVSDSGGWIDPGERGPTRDRGRGLDVMRELMGAVELTRGPDGTRVVMRHDLARAG